MINSVSQSPAFGKKMIISVRAAADGADAVKTAVEKVFEGKAAYKGKSPFITEYCKNGERYFNFHYDGNWGSEQIAKLTQMKKEFGMPTFVVTA